MFVRIGKCNLSPIDWNMILSNYGPVWYMCLKTEKLLFKNICEIRVDKKVCQNTCNVV